MPSALDEFLRESDRVLAPPPSFTVSQWADAERRLSPESSAEPGQWRTARAEYQRGIMDAVSDYANKQVVVMSSAQVGKTEILNNVIGFYIAHDPSPILVVQPTLEMGETWSKDRFAPMIRDTPSLTALVAPPGSKGSGNTLLHKTFDGGHITIAGSNSAPSLSSRPIRIVLLDEVDRYEASAGTEGDPVSLAIKRTGTFWNRRVVMTSTPTIKGISRIEQAFEHSDKRHFFVPCPHCLTFQVLRWSAVTPKDNPAAARIACEECGALIDDGERKEIIAAGEWRATAPFQGIAGFHLWEAYSPWRTLAEIVDDYIKAKPYPETLKVWWNTSLGESYEDQEGLRIAGDELAARAGDYEIGTVPDGALLLTAGVDVQHDRLALTVWGYGPGEEAWLIDWQELYGSPAESAVWGELDLSLSRRFPHESGSKLRVRAACIDAGDGQTTAYVLDYCRRRWKPLKVGELVRPPCLAIKGQSQAGKPPIGHATKVEFNWRGEPVPRAARLYPVGADTIKGWLIGRVHADAELVHFPAGLPDAFYEQFTAERLTTRFVKGMPKKEWIKSAGARNEAWDCSCYAYAAAVWANVRGANWAALRLKLSPPVAVAPKAPAARETVGKSNFGASPRRGFVTGWRA